MSNALHAQSSVSQKSAKAPEGANSGILYSGEKESLMESRIASNQVSTIYHKTTSPVARMGVPPKPNKKAEDIFVKNNLEYEQRLKTHLYQFEEQEINGSSRKKGKKD